MQIHRPSVLVVDDDFDICALVTAILSDEGFLVTSTHDLTALPEMAERLQPDVVLLEVKGYADQAAWDAAYWLHQRANPIPIIMFTTHPHLADVIGVTPSGEMFITVIQKPFELQELIAKVKAAAAGRPPMMKVPHFKPTPCLSDLLKRKGIADVDEDTEREWVAFKDERGAQIQIYWWAQASAYCICRLIPGAEITEDLGKCRTPEEAVERALSA
ncbi:MAG: response regulator transcription factor [Chloroflexi bacterium]|nr:response regulator transcription factor [Chloroflexota bacterium]